MSGFDDRDKQELLSMSGGGGGRGWMPCLKIPVSLFNSGYRLLSFITTKTFKKQE